jgi:hypothetical protein
MVTPLLRVRDRAAHFGIHCKQPICFDFVAASPGQQTRLTASTERYAIGLIAVPIDNLATEFLSNMALRTRNE